MAECKPLRRMRDQKGAGGAAECGAAPREAQRMHFARRGEAPRLRSAMQSVQPSRHASRARTCVAPPRRPTPQASSSPFRPRRHASPRRTSANLVLPICSPPARAATGAACAPVAQVALYSTPRAEPVAHRRRESVSCGRCAPPVTWLRARSAVSAAQRGMRSRDGNTLISRGRSMFSARAQVRSKGSKAGCTFRRLVGWSPP